MKFPTVDRFCFCMTLENGAIVLAGFCISVSVAVVTLASYLLMRYIAFYATLNETDQDFFRIVLIGSCVMHAVYVIYFSIVVVASIMLVVGVKMVRILNCYRSCFCIFIKLNFQRNHNQLLLFLIIMAAGVLVSSIQVIQLGAVFLVPALLATVCFTYFFIAAYSLFRKLKDGDKLGDVELQNYENVTLRR